VAFNLGPSRWICYRRAASITAASSVDLVQKLLIEGYDKAAGLGSPPTGKHQPVMLGGEAN
jgi:hypothetical protein